MEGLDVTEVAREHTDRGELCLRRYRASDGTEGYEILLDGAFLMASHGCHSERAMARLAWGRLAPPRADLQAFVGGLGAGHTLRATLDLPGVESVTVAEIGAEVVEWNRRYFAAANGDAVDDPRVRVVLADALGHLARTPRAWDLVLLDVDNGPGWLASPANAELYTADGLRQTHRSLAAGGVAAIWSPARNQQLERVAGDLELDLEVVDTTRLIERDREPPAVVYLVGGGTGGGLTEAH